MRVISGSARGRRLKEPVGDSIRPTSDRVKEAVFSIIQFDIEGRRVLDLFAGTGQLGIEALSRGAASAVFVDNSPVSLRLIRDNLRSCGLEERAMVYTADAVNYLKYDERFDIIFIDPPYDSTLVMDALHKITEFDKLCVNGIIICETRHGTEIPDIPYPYKVVKQYKYGTVALIKLTREPT